MINRSLKLEQDFFKTRFNTQSICERLTIEDHVVQPVAEVSPPKWHLGHTTWFLEELILNRFMKPFSFYDPTYRKIYNSYYKGLGPHWRQDLRGTLSRPTVAEVRAYRHSTDLLMQELLINERKNSELNDLVELAINHEEQHQELLLMDIKVILSANPSRPGYVSKNFNSNSPLEKDVWKSIPEGLYLVGTTLKEAPFHYDNEAPKHKFYLQPYSIREHLVTNGEYLNFIKENGYNRPLLWKSLGYDWVQNNGINRPLYWSENLDTEFTLYGEEGLDLSAPVSHVSFFEADAFARWLGMRLPTEEEFEVSSELFPLIKSANSASYHPENNGTFNSQLWCWTSSHYSPYPGFRPFNGKLSEYNGKFMCNQFVLRGGCMATPAGHYRRSYRNFYEPQQRWMFSGICLAKDNS